MPVLLPDPCSLVDHTIDAPFCGGVAVWHDDRLVFTLGKAKDRTVLDDGRTVVPLCWVGGGQELGETIVECAAREGAEELAGPVRLLDAGPTHWFEDGRPIDGTAVVDRPRPLVVEVRSSDGAPYQPGLPAGPHVWVALYAATTVAGPAPGDVPGLVGLGRADLEEARVGLAWAECVGRGLPIGATEALPDETVLRIRPGGPEQLLVDLWARGVIAPPRAGAREGAA